MRKCSIKYKKRILVGNTFQKDMKLKYVEKKQKGRQCSVVLKFPSKWIEK